MKIYLIENQINHKQYVGKTKLPIQRRFREHITNSKKSKYQNILLYKAFQKYGIENFTICEIDLAKTAEELIKKEKFWIKKLRTFGKGYNQTAGGDGSEGRKHSPETIEKIRQRALNRTPEQRDKYRRAQLGRKYGSESIDKMRQHLFGNQHAKGMTYQHTEDAKERIRQFQLNRERIKQN
jgi:group I intron endonuclease